MWEMGAGGKVGRKKWAGDGGGGMRTVSAMVGRIFF
jgi:hypothetical protein